MSRPHLISIIDDEASVRDATKDLVSSLGVDVFAFESAEEFLRSPQLEQTSCLITDVQMPGMSGHELQLHLVATGHRIPTIFITAFPEKIIRKRIQCAGAIGFLEKPFEAATLVDLLRTVMADDEPAA